MESFYGSRRVKGSVFVTRGDTDSSNGLLGGQTPKSLVVQAQHSASLFDQRMALLRQSNRTALGTNNERLVHERLEFLNLQRDRRWRASYPLRRARETQFLGDANKGAKEIEIENGAKRHY